MLRLKKRGFIYNKSAVSHLVWTSNRWGHMERVNCFLAVRKISWLNDYFLSSRDAVAALLMQESVDSNLDMTIYIMITIGSFQDERQKNIL